MFCNFIKYSIKIWVYEYTIVNWVTVCSDVISSVGKCSNVIGFKIMGIKASVELGYT